MRDAGVRNAGAYSRTHALNFIHHREKQKSGIYRGTAKWAARSCTGTRKLLLGDAESENIHKIEELRSFAPSNVRVLNVFRPTTSARCTLYSRAYGTR